MNLSHQSRLNSQVRDWHTLSARFPYQMLSTKGKYSIVHSRSESLAELKCSLIIVARILPRLSVYITRLKYRNPKKTNIFEGRSHQKITRHTHWATRDRLFKFSTCISRLRFSKDWQQYNHHQSRSPDRERTHPHEMQGRRWCRPFPGHFYKRF